MNTVKNKWAFLLAGCSIFFASCLKEYNNPAAGTPADRTFIYAVRDIYKGQEITLGPSNLGGARHIQGVVISDRTGQNIDGNSLFIQETVASGNQIGDITRGIMIRIAGADHTWNLGDSLRINVEGSQLDRDNGVLVIKNVAAEKVTRLAENRAPLVQPVTLRLLNALLNVYESTLVSVHADVKDYGPAVVFSGKRTLDDHTRPEFAMHTRAGASFAATNVPAGACFTGIPGYLNATGKDTAGAERTLTLRRSSDISFISGPMYAGFPEDFEWPDASAKASYNITATANNIDLATGNWKLQQAILGNTVIRDKFTQPGKQCIRMQQNLTTSALVQMNFDVTEGASKVTVFYGKYYTDPASTFRLEYSVNGGTTWVTVTPNISDMPERGYKQAVFPLNITGTVRFRINKLGLGSSSATVSNGRLCIEDIAIYKR